MQPKASRRCSASASPCSRVVSEYTLRVARDHLHAPRRRLLRWRGTHAHGHHVRGPGSDHRHHDAHLRQLRSAVHDRVLHQLPFERLIGSMKRHGAPVYHDLDSIYGVMRFPDRARLARAGDPRRDRGFTKGRDLDRRARCAYESRPTLDRSQQHVGALAWRASLAIPRAHGWKATRSNKR